MPALNFLIPAGRGAPTLGFEGSPASAHLQGRAGSLCPPLSSPDSSRRHLSPLVWCECAGGMAEPVGGSSPSPLSPPSPVTAKPSWRGKAPASHCWDLPIALPRATRTSGSGMLARGSGAAQTLAEANLPGPDTPPCPSCGGSGGCRGSQQEGAGSQCPASHGGHAGEHRCPCPPPCKGQAAGERWGVTQTGKLAGTQPFPAGTGKGHSGLCSGPELGTLAAAMGTPMHRTEPSQRSLSRQAPLRATSSLYVPPSLPTRGWAAPRFPQPKDEGLLPPPGWEPARLRVPRGIQGMRMGIQGMRMGLQGPQTSPPEKGLAEQRGSCSMPAQSLGRPLAAVQRWESSRWEAREKQGPEEGKTSRQTN